MATSGHTTSGTFGAAMVAAGGAGDPWSTSLPGSYGAGTAGFIVGTNLDALITSRMATYSQPSGFLAATFPATIASTTNITAGTLTTVTNLTNLPAITTDWLSAAGVSAAAGAKLADILLRRTQAHVEASSDGDTLSLHSLYGSLQSQQKGNTVIAPGFLTVYKTDGTSILGTLTLTSDAAAEPITGAS